MSKTNKHKVACGTTIREQPTAREEVLYSKKVLAEVPIHVYFQKLQYIVLVVDVVMKYV